ncbi:hypothetical protein BJX61DRAFT_537752 [Aspergillus egyptiacus]|nr:hypothetical protein BJX61DRAFT_537752 [Aspergillus egyptiacus]
MLQPRAMILRPRRIRWNEPTVLPVRQFSVFRRLGADEPPAQPSTPKPSPDQPKKLKIPPALLKYKESNPTTPRPRRVFDARSLSASRPGGRPGNVLKGPARLGGAGGGSSRARKPSKPGPKNRRNDRRPRVQAYSGESDTALLGQLEDVYRELAEKSKPVPTSYQPQPPDLQNLSETWPSVPMDVATTTAGVVEKLSLLSERYPNGYVPPHELGKRLFEGKYVHFKNEEEKAAALGAAKKYAEETADKLTQEKGELVDPQPVEFQSVKGDEHKSLLESLVQGKYPMVEAAPAESSPVVGQVFRSLGNNETYQVAGKKSQFMAKVESLLKPSHPAKRA